MADRVLSVKVTGEPSGLIAALSESQSAIKKLGSEAQTAAGGSKAEFSSLLQTIEKTDPALAGLAQSAAAAGLALDKVGDAKGISAYTTKLVEAQTRVDQYAERLAAAERAGVELGEKPVAALARMREGVEKLAEHLTNLRETSAASQAKIEALASGGEQGMSELAKAADAARQATEELSSVKGPEQLEGALKKGAWASLQLKEELARAAAAGEKIDDATVAALKAVEAQTQSSIDKMSRFRKEMADAGEVSKLGADKLDAAKNAAGGLGNVFDKLEKSSNGTASAIGKVGVSLGVAGAAIAGAVAAGRELADGIDKLSEKYAKFQQKQIDQKLALQQQEIALRAADRGLIEHGKTIAETVKNYDRYAVAQGNLSENSRKFIEQVAGLKIPPTFEDLDGKVKAIASSFEGAYKRSEEFGDRMLLENASVVEQLVQQFAQIGKEVPEDLRELADALALLKGAGDAASEGVGAAAGSVMTLQQAVAGATPALDGLRTLVMDAAKASEVAAAVNKQVAASLQESAAAVAEAEAEQSAARDKNTAALAESVAATDAWHQSLTDGMDAWASAGQAMGPVTVAVRQATEGFVSAGNAWEDMIEGIARANDTLGENAVFMGSWLAQLEAGNITVEEFRKRLDDASTGLVSYSAILRAAGVDAADAQQAISAMYAALNDVTFMQPAADWWKQFGITMESAFFKARDAAKVLKGELVEVEVVAGRVGEAVGGARGQLAILDDLLEEIKKKKDDIR